ncbi:MAG: M50 family metallopeptidase [Thermaerobacter sp.]|nr:M50 family metallopeptidase [Thermaerobacter sp.]
MTTLVAWVVVFGLLIAIHESGHFLVAKAFGMRVDEFSLGFGPALGKKRFRETLYALRAIPLGGYVRLAGMEANRTQDPREFPNRPLWQRFMVILAGPMMNLALAAVLYGLAFGPVGIPTLTTTVAQTVPKYPAYAAGVRPGDRIVRIDHQPIASWTQLKAAIQQHQHQSMTVTLSRGGKTQTISVQPKWDPASKSYIIGIQPATRLVRQRPLSAVWSGIRQTVLLTGGWFSFMAGLVQGRGVAQVVGPVGIAVAVGRAAQAGMSYLVVLSAGLSANLGLFNILPIPVLDGSRLALLALEGIRRKAMDPERETLIHLVGMVALLFFVLFVTYHDIVRYLHSGG